MIRSFISLCLVALGAASAFAQKSADKKKPAAPTTPAPIPKAVVQDVTPDAAEKLIAERKDLIVLDVRTAEEYDMGHIAGAKNASFIDSEFDEQIKEFEGKPLLIHCAAGNRSLRAVRKMMATGKFPEIYHLASGMSGWQEAGKPVVKSPKPSR